MNETETLTAGERAKRDILETGLRLWAAGVDPTARRIASELNVTHSAVIYHFNSVALKRALAFEAVRTGNSRVIVQLIGMGDKAIEAMSDDERVKHLRAAR